MALLGEFHPIIPLADITMIEAITIEDIREYGGGIQEDIYFGGLDERIAAHPYSKAYLDIANKNGMEIPQSVTFIKIHSDLLNSLAIQFGASETFPSGLLDSAEDMLAKKESLDYLKTHIEKHIGLGVFYCIVDENDELIYNKESDPFPYTGEDS